MHDTIERQGYIIARNLLPQREVEMLRKGLLSHFSRQWQWEGLGKHQPRAASEIPGISWLFAYPAIVDVFRTLTGSSQPVFTGNADAHMNMLSWWHKDTGEASGGCFEGDYFDRQHLRVYRAGIYLQDHHADGHGLHVRPGSHRMRAADQGLIETLSTRAGDVIFFDPRLSHAGQLMDRLEYVLFRAGRRLRIPGSMHYAKERWRQFRGKQAKLSLFFTYGAPGQDTDAYCAFEAKARRRVGGPNALTLSPQLLTALAAQQVACNPELTLSAAANRPITA